MKSDYASYLAQLELRVATPGMTDPEAGFIGILHGLASFLVSSSPGHPVSEDLHLLCCAIRHRHPSWLCDRGEGCALGHVPTPPWGRSGRPPEPPSG